MDIRKRLGRRIADLRKDKGMTLEKLAYEAEVSKGYLSEVERGKWYPSVATLQKIADGLELPLWSILVFPDESPLDAHVDALARGKKTGQSKKARS